MDCNAMYYIFAFKHQFGHNRSEKSGKQLSARFTNTAKPGDTSTQHIEPKKQ
jgi:hypothetical protein